MQEGLGVSFRQHCHWIVEQHIVLSRQLWCEIFAAKTVMSWKVRNKTKMGRLDDMFLFLPTESKDSLTFV